ncbi:MAG: YbaY family lipoprotein [Pseudomarimonas sp.]
MRALMFVASLVVMSPAVLGLVGCDQKAAPDPAAVAAAAEAAAKSVPPVPASAPAIRGEISIDGLTTLPPKLELRMRLLDMTDPSVAPPVVAERTEPAPATLPYSYALPFQPATVVDARRYVVEASLLAGGALLYGTPAPVAVLTQGSNRQAKLLLTRGSVSAADTAPAELIKQEFDALEAAIGGMERLTGERINDKTTIGWDGFAEGDDVRFARENVDYGDAGSATLRYGYKGGSPWVVAREQKGVLSLVGWGPDSEVILNRHAEGEQLDDAAIADLRIQAERLYAIVKARADAE